MTRWTHGALSPLTVEDYTLREVSEYVRAFDRDQERARSQEVTLDGG